MLHQLLYWTDRAKHKDGFVYKSSAEWQKELGVQDHAVRKFKKLPYIETIVHRAYGHPSTHYRVRINELKEALFDLMQMDLLKSRNGFRENSKSLVEYNEYTR